MTVFDLAINVETFVEIMFEWLRLNQVQPTPVYHTSLINGKQLHYVKCLHVSSAK